jgi:hypothetical protein
MTKPRESQGREGENGDALVSLSESPGSQVSYERRHVNEGIGY